MAKRKWAIIHHLHLYIPPDPLPKLSCFPKIAKAMKALGRFFSHKKEVGRDRVNARRDRMDARTSEELHWPSDMEESVFESEIEDVLED